MDYLMGIDLGSTSLKAVVYDTTGRLVAMGGHPTEKCHPSPEHPDWAVWRPEQIWGGTAAAIRAALARLDDPRQIRGVAVTGMGMDGLPIDADGQWLYPLISWHDPRTAEQFQWWKEHVGLDRTFSIGGNPGVAHQQRLAHAVDGPDTSRRSSPAPTSGCSSKTS